MIKYFVRIKENKNKNYFSTVHVYVCLKYLKCSFLNTKIEKYKKSIFFFLFEIYVITITSVWKSNQVDINVQLNILNKSVYVVKNKDIIQSIDILNFYNNKV